MKNGARYVVTTHWGTFSLDEGSYRDYLAGRLWISWAPGKARSAQPPDGCAPPDVSEQAIALRERAARDGVTETLRQFGMHEPPVPYRSHLAGLSIDELNLTVRASNGLRRANAGTFGQLRDLMATENGILSVRNLGRKSAEEIRRAFFEECYARLLPYERAHYWQEVLDARNKM